MEDKIRGVYFDENSDGVPKIGFTTSKDTYIVTFGEALEWWRQSDQAYHRHPLQLSLGRFNVHGISKMFEVYGYTVPNDGRRAFQLVFMDENRKGLGYIEASKNGVIYKDLQLSLAWKVDTFNLDSAAITESAGIYYIDWKKLDANLTLFVNKQNQLVIRRGEQEVRTIQLSLGRVKFDGVSDVTFCRSENGDMQIRIPEAKSWLCWNETNVFTWKPQVGLPQLGRTTCTSWLLTQTSSSESFVQSNATELPLLIVSSFFIWSKESY